MIQTVTVTTNCCCAADGSTPPSQTKQFSSSSPGKRWGRGFQSLASLLQILITLS